MSQTAHLVGADPDAFVGDASLGLALTNADLCAIPSQKIVCRRDIDTYRRSHVTIIGGGGAGHEPMFSGYVGKGFLSASVTGKVFASPSSKQILEAIRVCNSPKGVLLVMGNYTGDILHSGLAITRARAEGINVEFLAIGDDAAVGRSKGRKVGRRGLSGHLVALKLASALADEGADFDTVLQTARTVAQDTATMGVAFDKCSLPGGIVADAPRLPENTLELGVGIHGEPGVKRHSPIPNPKELVDIMLKYILDGSDQDRAFISIEAGDQVCLIINSLQGASNVELWQFTTLVKAALQKERITVQRIEWGCMVTSLDMTGLSITVYRLPREKETLSAQEALRLWDRPVECHW